MVRTHPGESAAPPAELLATLDEARARIAVLESLLTEQATRDPLTGLPNQASFAARMDDALAARAGDGRMLAVAFLDLDRFRTVNDVLGHAAGDKLLQQVAGRLAGGLGQENIFRMAGDEFVLLVESVETGEDHTRAFESVRAVLARPFLCQGHELFVTASIGVALYPFDGEDVPTLVKNADCAMFRAKERGGDTLECYSHGLYEEARRRLSLERSLRRAVERDEILLEYQPQLDLVTGRIIGLEALVRWRHPDLGIVAPGTFMPLAEETGFILPLGERILEMACEQARTWSARHPRIRVWVNVSARQFHQGDLPELVARCLERSALPPHHLGVEITESLAMRHPAEAAAVLGRLSAMGVATALDDFGTGYSSLAYLSRFPIDVLKLDGSFVERAPAGGHDAAIVRAVIGLAHGIGVRVVAEGVESEDQRAFLAGLGCEAAQGFLFARPLPAEAATRLLDGQGPPGEALAAPGSVELAGTA